MSDVDGLRPGEGEGPALAVGRAPGVFFPGASYSGHLIPQAPSSATLGPSPRLLPEG